MIKFEAGKVYTGFGSEYLIINVTEKTVLVDCLSTASGNPRRERFKLRSNESCQGFWSPAGFPVRADSLNASQAA